MSSSNPDYMWKISLFGPFNISVLVINIFFECIGLPLHWLYMLIQDMMMAIEVVKYRMAPEYQPLTGARLWQLLSRASWSSRVFALSWVGAHVVLYREFTTSPPQYCKEAFKRPAWQ